MTRHQYEKLIAKMEEKIITYSRKADDWMQHGGKHEAEHFMDKANIWQEAALMVIHAEMGEL